MVWDQFAKQDPLYYISTGSKDKGEDFFWESGKKTASFIFEQIQPYLLKQKRVLEIGAGIGRVAIPMSQHFEKLYAVDISSVMNKKLMDNCKRFGAKKIEVCLDVDHWDAEKFDFIYSVLTFQHIEDIQIIEQYIKRISQCLNGVAFLQFDTRSKTIFYYLKNLLPDCLCPKGWKKGMRRIRKDAKNLRGLFKQYNLDIIKELEPNSKLHVFILK